MEGAILILGKNGQLGRALAAQLKERGLALAREDADFRDADFISKLETKIAGRHLTAVINATAYNLVDKAEGEGRGEAFRVNAEAVGELAAWCKSRALPFVHFSTDYVFDGSGSAPWREGDAPGPLSEYGKSKLAGELAVAAAGGEYLLFRTSWVYDATGKNFFNTMLRLFGEKESLNVVADQVGAPSYAPHLAAASLNALETALTLPKFPTGTYHLCGGGETSWHGFAQAIFALARTRDSGQKSQVACQRIQPIPSSGYPLPAKRPLNSRLDCSKAKTVLGAALPDWHAGLLECFEEKYGHQGLRDRGDQDHSAHTAGG